MQIIKTFLSITSANDVSKQARQTLHKKNTKCTGTMLPSDTLTYVHQFYNKMVYCLVEPHKKDLRIVNTCDTRTHQELLKSDDAAKKTKRRKKAKKDNIEHRLSLRWTEGSAVNNYEVSFEVRPTAIRR
ncbi:uncharacterized protein LOC121596211 [Anopheles merus]|uniref:uncharacterized protein LOC121596211 n=1 Tax=Anopheles merus TaxID=30066 RepID=UPI001BE3FBFE|nr:uncharacterized protein LOC121596211 [Anopheles merus]